jgi:hypothetical protein
VGRVERHLAAPEHGTFPGLYVRVGEEIREATEADQAVARSYPDWQDKGPNLGGRRITILPAKTRVRPNEEVRVIHVAEATDPTTRLYTAGPKAVLGEYVDGGLATPPAAEEDPLRPPGLYDGPVVSGPSVDYGYDVTTYRFTDPGTHRILWRLGDLVSNEVLVVVEK